MSIYNNAESGTKRYTSRFHKTISYTKHFDCRFGDAVPVLEKFVLAGDVWKIGGEVLIRFQPMLTPSFTPCKFKVRYFFVPLRLIEKNTETIITGSTDGHLYSGTLPTFTNFVDEAIKANYPNCYKVQKYSFWDYMGIPIGDYESIKNDECLPAAYWLKAYMRILWDYYFDENISTVRQTFNDFESWWNLKKTTGADSNLYSVEVPKDYIMSALPWQLKGTTPVLDVYGTGSFTPSFGDDFDLIQSQLQTPAYDDKIGFQVSTGTPIQADFVTSSDNAAVRQLENSAIKQYLNQTQSNVTVTGLGFNADDLRTLMAQTRIFERLARCGSRFTEYLKSNFGVAPADGTLQRAQYLGGWSLPVVTTEVLQTAADGGNPVGTMRGHGISRGGQKIRTFFANEPGILFGIAHILPKIQYTQGIKRELTYKRRFDFFNPSFQHLSEQEVRNGELYISFTDGKNDETLGFQAYANELRSSRDMIVGDFRDSLSYWNQGIKFSTRPNLDNALIDSASYRQNFNQCFVLNTAAARNVLVDFYNDLDVYRPMVKYATPGLVDHL